jgi:hypothetical protein
MRHPIVAVQGNQVGIVQPPIVFFKRDTPQKKRKSELQNRAISLLMQFDF